MRAELTLPLATLWGFLLVLARVGGALLFVPVPGLRSGPEPARIVLALGFTAALYPLWPRIPVAWPGPGQLLLWLAAETAFGLSVGVAVAFLSEGLLVASQLIGIPAGYSYAATIDPTTQADSNVLQVIAHLMAGGLFLALGLDRQVLRIFAQSLETIPPGAFALRLSSAQSLLALGGGMFTTGMRLALPVLALMALLDITLALLGRMHAQMQLLMLAFPVKMLAGLALLAMMIGMARPLFQAGAERTLTALAGLVARAPGTADRETHPAPHRQGAQGRPLRGQPRSGLLGPVPPGGDSARRPGRAVVRTTARQHAPGPDPGLPGKPRDG